MSELKYNNNPFLKPSNAGERCTQEEFNRRKSELFKCKKDLFYFAENYFKLINRDGEEAVIEFYPKQRELLCKFLDKNRIVTLASRQSGKCLSWMSLCTFKHKKLNLQIKLPIGVFYLLCKLLTSVTRVLHK